MKKEPFVLAISGVKNSGKTTLITRILPILNEMGLKVAVVKHDGHEFEADVPGTDTYRQMEAGAYGTAVFSKSKFMVVKREPSVSAEQLMGFFPEADVILLEGMKYSHFPKLELIRRNNTYAEKIPAEPVCLERENSKYRCVCAGHHLLGIVSDLEREEIEGLTEEMEWFALEDAEAVAEYIVKRIENSGVPCK